MDANTKIVSGDNIVESTERRDKRTRDAVYLIGAAGVAAVAAGVVTAVKSKKQARQYLASLGHKLEDPPENGTALAIKALCYSTVFTVGIFSLSIFGLCKWFHIKDLDDLKRKIRKRQLELHTPNPDERTEFDSLTDFINYLSESGKKQQPRSA